MVKTQFNADTMKDLLMIKLLSDAVKTYKGFPFRLTTLTGGLIFSLAVLTISLPAYGNQNDPFYKLRFERLTVEQGLSQSSVLCSLQDSRGFLWFGTYDGLNRYDGDAFKIYRYDLKDDRSISDNGIRALVEDHDGIIWVGTSNSGLNAYDRKTDSFKRYLHDPNKSGSISGNEIRCVFVDSRGTLYVGARNGLNIYDRKSDTFKSFKHDPDDGTTLSSSHVESVGEDTEGNIWVGTELGLDLYRPEDGSFKHYLDNVTEIDIPAGEGLNVTSILSKNKGIVWAGTADGIFRVNKDDGSYHIVLKDQDISFIYEDRGKNIWVGMVNGLAHTSLEEFLNSHNNQDVFRIYRHDAFDAESLAHDFICSVTEDQSGILWFGTYGDGISKHCPARMAFGLIRHEPWHENSLNGPLATAVCQDDEGLIWVGNYNYGYNIINRATGEVKRFPMSAISDNPDEDRVQYIMKDSLGNIWIGTGASGLFRFNKASNEYTRYQHDENDPESLSQNNIYYIFEDSNGTIWVGTSKKGLNRLDRKTGKFKRYLPDKKNPDSISHKRVRHIVEDKQGRLWIGTNKGLNLFDPKTEKFRHWKHDPEDPFSLSHNRVTPIILNEDGSIWVGTDKGLNLFDPKTEKFQRITEKNGLRSDAIQCLLKDSKGDLWMSTFKGISKYNHKSGVIRNYDTQDGLQGLEFWFNSFFKNDKGELFFGGVKGLNVFKPEDITDNKHVPPVVLTSFKIMNKPVKLPENISETDQFNLTYHDMFFSFGFAGLDFNNQAKNQYAYKLEGFDKEWVHVGNTRTATYTNLDHGEYVFRVRAANNSGVWNNDGLSVRVVISPPFWRTLWFRAVFGLSVIILVFGAFYIRIRALNRRNEMLDRLVGERTAELEDEITERKQIQVELQESRDRMEEKVIERTSELENVNEALKQSERMVRENFEKMKQAQTSLVEQFDLLNTMMDSIPTPVFYKDLDGRFLGCNEAYADFFGISRKDILGKTVFDTAPKETAEYLHKLCMETFEHKEPSIQGSHLITIAGIRHDILFHRALFRDGGGAPAGMVGVMVDITEMKKIEGELIEHQGKLKRMGAELSLAEERERRRIAEDLHDHIGQSLALSKIRLKALAQIMTDPEIVNYLDEICVTVDEMIKESRSLTMDLSPPVLYEFGFEAAVEWLAEQMKDKHDIDFRFEGDGKAHFSNNDDRVILYRVVRELLTNVVKHAGSTTAFISISEHNGLVRIDVRDNGKGFDPADQQIKAVNQGSFGLMSVRERLENLGGYMEIESEKGRGATVSLFIPVNTNTPDDEE